MSKRKQIIIVGNADLKQNLSSTINAADFVLRFNEPRFQNGWAGTKTTCLMMCNAHKPMQLKLKDPAFLKSEFLSKAEQVVFVYHPSIMRKYFRKPPILSRLFNGRKVDWTQEGIEVLGSLNKDILIKSPQFYLEACKDIYLVGDDLKKRFPSTGYLGTWHCLKYFDLSAWDIKMCGFTWEGWKRHDWDAEKDWMKNRVEDGSISFL